MPRRVAAPLTARRVDTVKTKGLYADGGGLYLRVTPGGTRSWVYRYQVRGRRRDLGLGAADLYTLAEAREKARVARRLVADGVDPIDRRRSERMAAAVAHSKIVTFREAAEAYIKAHRSSWKSAVHAAQWPSTLAAYVYPVMGKLSVQAIDTALVLKALEPIWTDKPETAGRVRGRIESVLDWAAARGHRQGQNPARWKGHLENLLPRTGKIHRVKHHAALPYSEIADFMVRLRARDGAAARALEFLILTAARTGEVIGARWVEISIDDKLWVIPPERMKAGKEHRVPLSEAATTVIRGLLSIREGEYVFPGGKVDQPLSNMAMLTLLRRMDRSDLTAHGFRSTFRDWVAETTSFPTEVAEMALAHSVSDKVEAAYRRGDLFEKRRRLAEAWAEYCAVRSAARSPEVSDDDRHE